MKCIWKQFKNSNTKKEYLVVVLVNKRNRLVHLFDFNGMINN